MPSKRTDSNRPVPNGQPVQAAKRFRFSGHQTFVARNGWLEKGVRLVQDNPGGFLADDAVVRLGVGKNMVESIKYWCLQTGLIEEADDDNHVPGQGDASQATSQKTSQTTRETTKETTRKRTGETTEETSSQSTGLTTEG